MVWQDKQNLKIVPNPDQKVDLLEVKQKSGTHVYLSSVF